MRDIESEPPLTRAAVPAVQRHFAFGGRLFFGASAWAAVLFVAPAILIGVLAWPMLFTEAGFNEDWVHHAWYIWNQGLAIGENHRPSIFLNYSRSVLYPEFAFYGGTLYAIAGALSALLGNAPIAVNIFGYIVGFAAAYGGWYWLSRMAGVSRWWAQVPALLFITSAYYMTLIYGRGDLQELLGISTIPLLLASGISVLRAERLRLGPALALTGSGILYFGSHNLTIVWGSTVLAILGCVALVVIPETRDWLSRRGILRVGAILLATLLVSAWFLLPAAVYQSHTVVSANMARWEQLLELTMPSVSAHNIFALSRASAFPGADFALSLPVLAMAWALVCLFVYRRGGLRSPWLKLLLTCAVLASLLTLLMTHAQIVFSLPHPYALLQFAFRLESYIILAVVGAVLAGLVLAQRAPGRLGAWRWALVAVALVSIVGAIQQTDAYTYGANRNLSVQSRTLSGTGLPILADYLDVNVPTIPPGRGPNLNFPLSAVHGDRVSEVVHFKPHQLVYTNVAGDPELVHISGAKTVGRSYDGNQVVEIEPPSPRAGVARGGSTPAEIISARETNAWPLVVGRWLSLAAVLSLLTLFVVLLARSARGRAPSSATH